MNKKNSITIALVFAVLLIATVFNISFIQPVLAVTWIRDDWCVCDHYDNEAYFGTAFDMWTGSALTGWHPQGVHYFSFEDQYFDSGYGGTNPGVPPLYCYWGINTEGSGCIYDWSTNYTPFTYGYQLNNNYFMGVYLARVKF